jgi:hypothetical protein
MKTGSPTVHTLQIILYCGLLGYDTVCVCVCVRACVGACVRVRVCVCVYKHGIKCLHFQCRTDMSALV